MSIILLAGHENETYLLGKQLRLLWDKSLSLIFKPKSEDLSCKERDSELSCSVCQNYAVCTGLGLTLWDIKLIVIWRACDGLKGMRQTCFVRHEAWTEDFCCVKRLILLGEHGSQTDSLDLPTETMEVKAPTRYLTISELRILPLSSVRANIYPANTAVTCAHHMFGARMGNSEFRFKISTFFMYREAS
jgi:hypothetical protein